MTVRSIIRGSGSALPVRAVSNAEIAKMVDTTDEWIVERTGIRNRYIAGKGETTSTLATEAARKACEAAGVDPKTIDLIVLATATPDQTFPATATIVQQALGCTGGIAFDVAAVCTGFLYALGVADSMLRTGMAKRALVIGAETFSRILDWEDRTTCVLFGDGAGAILIEAAEVEGEGAEAPGIIATRLHADGTHNELLYVDGGPSTTGTVGKVRMKGREVFRHAVVNLAQVLEEVLADAGKTAADLAEMQGVLKSQMAETLALLEKVGAISRVKRGRTKVITVTPEGAFRGDVNRHAAAVDRYRAEVVQLRPEPAE